MGEMGTPKLESLARDRFGVLSFREQQKEAMEAILAGRDCLVIHPTGGGKSLIFQLTALVLPGLTLVVSPLVSLIRDQVRRLSEAGITETAMLSSVMSPEDRRETMRRLPGKKILFVTPERAARKDFLSDLAAAGVMVSQMAVDEAHCVSRWGRSFRPDYRKLSGFRSVFPEAVVSAFTGTASPEVERDIVRLLGLRDPVRFHRSARRPNLALRMVFTPDAAETLLANLPPEGASIVYMPSRRETERLAHLLRAHGHDAMAYHAGMERAEREVSQDAFMRSRRPVMVATSAFGMGIDRPDIRAVFHAGSPLSLEDWYQEAGRAGRDGKPARAEILLGRGELREMERRWEGFYPSWKRLRRMAAKSVGPIGERQTLTELTAVLGVDRHNLSRAKAEYQAMRERTGKSMREMRAFVTASGCRQDLVAAAFGEDDKGCVGCGGCVSEDGTSCPESSAMLSALSDDFRNVRGLFYALTGTGLSRAWSGEWGVLRGTDSDRLEAVLHDLVSKGLAEFGVEGESVRISPKYRKTGRK
jgi:ATP-dependent DNA helicase RecQ